MSGTGLWELSSLESQKGTIERYEKLDAGDGEAAQAIIVGDKEVDANQRRAGELNGIRRPDAAVASNLRVSAGGLAIECNEARRLGEDVLVSLPQALIALLSRLHEYLAQRQRRGAELIGPLEHSLPERGHAIRQRAGVLQEIDEEVGVPEDPAHCHPSRRRRTYSSASSSAQSSRPEPRRARRGSASGLSPRCDAYSRSYQSSSGWYLGGIAERPGVTLAPRRASSAGSPCR